MLFYTSTFLAILIALLAVRLVYKAVFASCDVVSNASAQVRSNNERYSIAANASGHLDCGVGSKAVTGPLMNPGANNHASAWDLVNKHSLENTAKHRDDNVWPPRAAIGAQIGKASKVRRYDGGPKTVTLDMVSKPFRRDSAADTLAPAIAAKPSVGSEDSEIPSHETISKRIVDKDVPVKSDIETGGKPWGW